jgi:protein AATF/BFR2
LREAKGKEEKEKDIDRKASKNRKIRYVVHDKIVNFLTPLDNISLIDDKNNIITSLFGKFSSIQD